MPVTIHLAESSESIARCFVVMSELRPHVAKDAFESRVRRQQEQGYKLACAESEGEVRAVAGFRVFETLAWGRICYVDDLVTREADRGGGFGSALIDWLVAEARRAGCDEFHLDSGVHRFGAHRFYLHKGMDITCHHFAMKL
ncbi:MAG: GNAT family N-acetyltransferase [Verrucomicrobiaceae bacterium]|nr:GNAT family N-acetyltransferase [Verrucomicrobiaceae bacterium]